MLQGDLVELRNLVEQYEALALLHEQQDGNAGVRQRLEDVSYTLCVSTCTRDVAAALAAARHRLPDAYAGGGASLGSEQHGVRPAPGGQPPTALGS